MRLAMVSYFDIGVSYGIGDEVFPKGQLVTHPVILQIGIRNPLGDGIACDLLTAHPHLIADWRKISKEMVNRKEMELGWTPELGVLESNFKNELVRLIEKIQIVRCELAIFGIGTVLLWLEFKPGIPLEYLHGVSQCFEFAAYTVPISQWLHDQALSCVHQAIGNRKNTLTRLSKRPLPEIEVDAEGYKELRLIKSFTDLILCIDEKDDLREQEIVKAVESHDSDREWVNFEYHGKIHFGWADCIVIPRDLADKDEDPEQQIARILEDIKIAHVFLGTCEAFEKLFLSEIFSQVGNYVKQTGEVRSSGDLNRLRTLALAVVSLTNYDLVTVADEDQAYFNLFEKHACIQQRHENIQNRCEILYSVQSDETQAEETSREQLLNNVVGLLTALTLISVLLDSYNFIQQNEQVPIPNHFVTLRIVISLMAMIVLVMVILQNGQPWFRQLRNWFCHIRKSRNNQLQRTPRRFS